MKQFKFVAVAILLIGAVNAWADDAKPAEQRVHVSLLSVDNSKLGTDIKVAPADYPGGVFVKIKEGFSERPISASIFAAKLKKLGFKIVDKPEDADVIFRVGSINISFREIEQNADGIDARKVDLIAGTVGTAIATGGISLLVATDWSGFGNTRPENKIMLVILENPKTGKQSETAITGIIKADESGVKATIATFNILSDEWMIAHVVGYTDDQKDNLQPAPASAVSASK